MARQFNRRTILLAFFLLPAIGCSNTDSKGSEPAAEVVPQTPEALLKQSAELRRAGKAKEARDAALQAFTLARSGPRVAERLELAKAQAAGGNSAGAINEIKSLEREKREENVPVDEVSIAEVYAQIGDPNAVFRWLSRAVEAKSPNLATLQTNQDLEPVKADPRWPQFLATVPK
jgi:lipopolysaccharide biosynthesis regulator YciM